MTAIQKTESALRRTSLRGPTKVSQRWASISTPLDPKGDGRRLGERLGDAFRDELVKLKSLKK